MSRFDAFVAGLGFRTATPRYEAGDELDVIVTGRDGDDALVRIGDTVLRLPGADVAVDDEVRIRVTEFDAYSSTGTAELA
ncbi:hypothetical protein JCM30237_05570 [Halolamina litorea]|jgi:hypothetical protein|uniref:DUF7513 domain-containing protein n=1 Tax=Halolamina litorea TaxID=1515593 RepID=A0ABD6BQW1_9EURY|nr:hypothetical protein [Halolamina litorea]